MKNTKTKIISIYNFKGGVAKTTSTTLIGQILSKKGYKVLVIDLDPQGSLSTRLGYDTDTISKKTIREVLFRTTPINECILNYQENYDFIPVNFNHVTTETELLIKGLSDFMNPSHLRLKEAIDESDLKNIYDYIIIDCPPSAGLFANNALLASDKVLIPTGVDNIGKMGLIQVMKLVEEIQKKGNCDLEIAGIFITMSRNTSMHREEIKNYAENKELGFCETVIPLRAIVNKSNNTNSMLPNNKESKDIIEAYEKLLYETGLIEEN